MSLLSRILGKKTEPTTEVEKAGEGSAFAGPALLSDGWLSAQASRFVNWWQMGYSLQPYGQNSAMVEACVSAYAQTIAMCPGAHWVSSDNGGRELQKNSALSRIMKSPNDYQSISDFMMNLAHRLYTYGEVFALALRNGREEIASLHLMRHGQVYVAKDGSVFYGLSGNEVIENKYDLSLPIPARDVLHVRLHTPRHVLKGVSPILATALDLALQSATRNQQIAFYLNQAKPSFVLETDEKLTLQQVNDLREAWNKQTQGENAGGTPILSWGLKTKPVGSSAKDAELAEILKMSDQNIALAFRVPLQILGVGGTPFASTELLMQSWVASGLGFALNHIEEAFGHLFRLGGYPDDYLELDTKALLRSAFKERLEALSRGVISGIYSPDEARNEEGLARVPGGVGAEPRVQQQVVPLSYGVGLQPPKPADEEPSAEEEPEDDGEPEGDEDDDSSSEAAEDAKGFEDVILSRVV